MLGLRSAKDAATLIDPRLHPSPVAAIPFLPLPTSPQSFSWLPSRPLKPLSPSPLHLSVPFAISSLRGSAHLHLCRFESVWRILEHFPRVLGVREWLVWGGGVEWCMEVVRMQHRRQGGAREEC